MVFFQASLLGGYAYAHASAARLRPSRQVLLHLIVLAVPLAVLPLAVNPRLMRGGETNPVLDVLTLLSVSVGLPFLVVSATAPLLQQWFTRTGHPAARDPYFLYAASNLGSMLALLGYPTLVEPRLPLQGPSWLTQTTLWSVGYGVLAALTALCALTLWWKPAGGPAAASEPADDAAAGSGLGGRRRLHWIALAFVPSSLLLGATTYITTDLAAVPLLWVLPLTIYLLTFILAFGRWPRVLQRIRTSARLYGMLRAPPEAATGGSGPDRRPAALRAHALRGRHAAVRDAADGGQDDPAAARRHARGVEHVHGVLPGRAARRLRLRAREHRAAAALAPGAPASGRARAAPGGAAPGREPAPAAGRRGQPGARRAHAPVGLGGPALPGGERDRAAAAEVVHPDRAPGRARSVLPLRGEQPRQHAGAAGLPDPGRAAPAAAGPELAHPDHAVERGLRRARGR